MSLIAATGLRAARPAMRKMDVQRMGRRFITPGPNWHFPFNFTRTTNRALALKFGGALGFAFCVPFVAIWWHWNRPGGLNHSKA
ncbi:hypothetical protein D9611_009659 [Ephemerocybe angulata]|uniref:Cytochrome c oxidase subunit 8, mitochondrial n=1 Tax=Ephemerocybe angulata TaxID=980116 RepID=A0A8H5FG14_9AGAR|nr:hypothetical protein D9611_009659 [Tulosesus angulatus]